MEHIDRLALIAGNGKFPLFLAHAAIASGVELITIAIISETDKEIEKIVPKIYWVHVGQVSELLDILKEQQIRYAVMAGKITKVTMFKESLHLDEEAKKLLGRVIDKRDDTLLSAVAHRLNDFGIELIDSTTFVKGMMPSKGVLTKKRPDAKQMDDIQFGYRIAKEIGRLDIGQAVAIKDKAVIAVEGIEGTDGLIQRAGELAGEHTIIVKVAKPNQDMRFDVPVVGLRTIESLKKAGSSVLAIEAQKVLVLEEEEVVRDADMCGLVVVAI